MAVQISRMGVIDRPSQGHLGNPDRYVSSRAGRGRRSEPGEVADGEVNARPGDIGRTGRLKADHIQRESSISLGRLEDDSSDGEPRMSSSTSDTSYTHSPTLRELNAELAGGIASWLRLVACPACNERSIATFATIRHISHSRCRDCGFTFANPIPPDEVLHAFYNSTFYGNYRQLEGNRTDSKRYFSISMYTDMRRLASWLGKDRSLTILDYGCGPGAFLAFLRDEFGFSNVEGLEINRDGIEIARRKFGLAIASSTEELQHQSYDCVMLLEVIEHVPDPGAFFGQVAGLINPGGRVLITTPAVDNLVGRFFPSQCPHYTAPCHVSLFTRQSIIRLLTRFGFIIDRIEIDECVQIMEKTTRSLLYDLDFMSPRHDDDLNDTLFVPNLVGRLLGLRPRRQPPDLFRRVWDRFDRLLVRLARRVPGVPMNDHLYVLAHKPL